MQSQHETEFDEITCKMPEYSMVFGRQTQPDGEVFLNPKIIIFEDKSLYQLFKNYLNNTLIESCRNATDNASVASYLKSEFNDEAKQVTLGCGFGIENVVGKFFLETNLDWPQYYYDKVNYIIPECKQPVCGMYKETTYGKGVPVLYMGRQGKANIPDNIMSQMNSKNAINKFVPLLAQGKRTPSFFSTLPEDILSHIAYHLEPHLSSNEAGLKLQQELKKAEDFHAMNRLFSYEEVKIVFSTFEGTQVSLNACDSFKGWFAQLPLKKAISLKEDYVLFKLDDNTLAINSGPGTLGIQVKKVGNGFIACNNITADKAETDCALQGNRILN